MVIHHNSLAATLDAVNEALFNGRSLSKAEKEEAARWIADQQVKGGGQAGLLVGRRTTQQPIAAKTETNGVN